MKRLVFGLAAIFCYFGLIGCASIIPVDNNIYETIEISKDDVTGYQYFIYPGIMLSRVDERAAAIGAAERGVQRGTLVIQTGRDEDKKPLDADTMCRVMSYEVEENEYGEVRRVLHVGFERLADGTIPTMVFATDWELASLNFPDKLQKFYLVFNCPDGDERSILYNNTSYRVTNYDESELSDQNLPYLQIRIRVKDTQTQTVKKIKGLKI